MAFWLMLAIYKWVAAVDNVVVSSAVFVRGSINSLYHLTLREPNISSRRGVEVREPT